MKMNWYAGAGAPGRRSSLPRRNPGPAVAAVGRRERSRAALSWALRLVTLAALAVDAYVHLHLAPSFDSLKKTVSQGQLFRLEAVAAILVGVLLLVVANRLTWLAALLVLAGGLAAVLAYQYVDVGALGPLPDMHDPVWTGEKLLSAVAEGAGAVTAAAGLLLASGDRGSARSGHRDR